MVNVATGMTYAPLSNLLTSMTHGNGLVTTAGYDLDYRLTSLTLKNGAANVSSLAYAYGDGINLTGITDLVTAANSNTLGYSPANRLSSATGPWGTESLSYDATGNRLNDNVTLGATTTTRLASYPASSNRITSLNQNAATFRTYAHDAAGNISNDNRSGEAFVFTYNKRNRMASVTRNGLAYATYGYNALEQLTTRSTSASGGPVGNVAYLYDLDGHLIAEATASTGATTRDYIWAAANDNNPVDLPLAVAEAATLYMVHSDHLGRPIRMTDSTKATVWQANYKPFGEPVTISGTKANNLRFPGQYFQIETNLAYNWHRHYDPTTGRYTQPDPLRFVDGPSVYAYAGNSPLMRTDRDGRDIDSLPLPQPYGLMYKLFKWSTTPTPQVCSPTGGLNVPPMMNIRAPGQPSERDGYRPPKNWNGQTVQNPNGSGSGFPDNNGNVWVPTDHNGTHAPHWDVQHANGSHTPVYPQE